MDQILAFVVRNDTSSPSVKIVADILVTGIRSPLECQWTGSARLRVEFDSWSVRESSSRSHSFELAPTTSHGAGTREVA